MMKRNPNWTEDELVTMFDKWMFVLHNLYRLLERPKALQDRIFQKLFEQAEIARYSETERRQYEESNIKCLVLTFGRARK